MTMRECRLLLPLLATSLTSQHLYVVVHTDHGLRYSGIGIISVITITYISMYYNVIISWV